ncbi:MAG: pseudouridine synthase [Kiloniellaceae bacterium]
MAEIEKGERVAKVIARAGLCSRRDAEAWILAGRVKVDGRVLASPAAAVTSESRIEVDGEPLPAAAAPRLFRYHKPRGEITTERDPQGRTTVFDHLPPELPRLQAVGRLDINSEGLLLLTNDGALKRQLELPSSGWLRRYRVRAHGRVTAERLAALAKGVTVEGVDYGPVEASLDRQAGANAWLTVGLREGKNREVRKICAHLGLSVNRLIRIAYGPFTLGKLPKRGLDEVETARLRQALGLEEKIKKKHGKGYAKAKPKPNRPGSRRGFKHQREAAEKGPGETREPRGRGTPAAGTKPAPPRKPAPAKPATRKPAPGKAGVKKIAARKAAAKPSTARKSHANRRRPS